MKRTHRQMGFMLVHISTHPFHQFRRTGNGLFYRSLYSIRVSDIQQMSLPAWCCNRSQPVCPTSLPRQSQTKHRTTVHLHCLAAWHQQVHSWKVILGQEAASSLYFLRTSISENFGWNEIIQSQFFSRTSLLMVSNR